MEDAEELARTAEWRQARENRCTQREDKLRRQGELPLLTAAEQEEHAKRSGENMRKVSWIWTGAGTTGSDADLEEALRIEWCKAWARTKRWHEELRLVEEEVRRAGVSLEYRAREWEEHVRGIPVSQEERTEWGALPGIGEWTVECAEGAIAYSLKQAEMYRDIAQLVNDDEWVDVVGATQMDEGDGDFTLEEERGDERQRGLARSLLVSRTVPCGGITTAHASPHPAFFGRDIEVGREWQFWDEGEGVTDVRVRLASALDLDRRRSREFFGGGPITFGGAGPLWWSCHSFCRRGAWWRAVVAASQTGVAAPHGGARAPTLSGPLF
ncbi:hypothetical protein B0H14DRAFT_3506857 [Mycena olivaceomarginata]|nr:hypothetical protein B0H14DRAFT_3506857 [Mycena olivaceomarginata]